MKFWLSQLLTRLKRKRRALALLRDVVRENPRHAQAWNCIGFLLAEQGQTDEALAAFERVLALAPQDARSHFNVAYLLQRLGRHEAAIARFERALALDPGIDRARKALDASRAVLEK